MSRDGYLPPGCTERDVDMAAPGYWESGDDNEEQRMVAEELERMERMCDQLCGQGYRAEVMLALERIIKENRLTTFFGEMK